MSEEINKKHIAVYPHTHQILTALAFKEESYADVVDRLLRQNPDYEKWYIESLKAKNRVPTIS